MVQRLEAHHTDDPSGNAAPKDSSWRRTPTQNLPDSSTRASPLMLSRTERSASSILSRGRWRMGRPSNSLMNDLLILHPRQLAIKDASHLVLGNTKRLIRVALLGRFCVAVFLFHDARRRIFFGCRVCRCIVSATGLRAHCVIGRSL